MHFLEVSITKKWDLLKDNSEEKPFVAILSGSIHIMPGLKQFSDSSVTCDCS